MNIKDMTLRLFLQRNRLLQEDWENSALDWDELKNIGIDHQAKYESLSDTAEFLAKTLQKCTEVHSVRWRVKNAEHLMEKIVRKRQEKSNKYENIDVSNYSQIITDLVGVRVLHLFKNEWESIHKYILSIWEPEEQAVAYIRAGDQGEIIDSYIDAKCEVKDHPAGYRSIHYVISSQPTSRKVISEIQVRTIFEEGWSEIDHKVRYPNFSDNQLIAYFLTIFNRMSGSADEMGTFVKNLTYEISMNEELIEKKNKEQEDHLNKIEELISELKEEKKQSKNKDSNLARLKDEVHKLRVSSASQVNVPSNFIEALGPTATKLAGIGANNGLAAAALAGLGDNMLGKNTGAILAAAAKDNLFASRLAQVDRINQSGVSAIAESLKGKRVVNSDNEDEK